ncbi:MULTISPECIES: aldo/keto reductase [unclassified Aeromicrobium]|uniref:aldo/keto reductase n=1 Tax=unclassified Aeromicrobium TaxID=2633570 RepID=UPI0006FF6BE3|nr:MULTISPECIES: aldo/keto reductase [unclassified Aeromicrobium]KQO39065.1 aldo/keto reductase [Aeromicrobium sp. Leaf245]KQP24920.1 aldo/keto reductase [Aeromicrobium sp. Leaf272]KQP79577.1 aldo/keto reductase [Aeromicrobium sp. Leaf289]
MQERHVGHSGLQVSRLGLGTMTFGSQVDELEAEDQLTAFLEAGGTFVDTAPVYGEGRAEALVGDLLAKRGVRDDVVLASKAVVGLRRGQVVSDASHGHVLAQLDASLRALRTDHLDLWQLHAWDPLTPWEETLAALEHAVSSGRVRYVGVSNFSGWQVGVARTSATRALGPLLVSHQVEYSLLNRTIEDEVVPAAQHLGLGTIAWSPLARGVLTGKYRSGVPSDSRAAVPQWEHFMAPYLSPECAPVVESVVRAAEGLDVSPAHVALAWVRERPTVATTLLGARTTAQLRTLLASETLDLPAEIVSALDDVSAPHAWED